MNYLIVIVVVFFLFKILTRKDRLGEIQNDDFSDTYRKHPETL